MSVRKWSGFLGVVAFAIALTPAWGAVENITGFETDREGVTLPSQPGSFGDLRVVMFQDPREADVTAANIVSDTSPNADTSGVLPATEESFVANFVGDGFFGAGGSNQSLDIRFQWANTNGSRWCLVETFQSPLLGDPSIHLDGTVSMKINFPLFVSEFPALNYTDRIGVALLVRETGNNFPLGFQDGGTGALEFVGVSTVGFADTANPVPVPTTYIDAPTSSGDQGWVALTFDLATAPVAGWTFNGGDGILDATTNGDLVNRGVLAGLVLTVDPLDAGAGASNYVEFLVDDIVFSAPVNDPAFPPSIGTPLSEGQTSVRVKNVLSSATNVSLEVDTTDPYDFADATVTNFNTGLPGALFVDIPVAQLVVGNRLRARQTNPSGTSAYSATLVVNPPAAFTFTLSLDEDGNNGAAPADFEFVGAASTIGGAPQGKPVFAQTGAWQNVEFSLIPGIEPVLNFAGGNGALQPDGGLYNIDSIWFSIDPTVPNPGPYDVFVDHVYYIDAGDNEVLISGAEGTNPFPSYRGQSTTNGFSVVSTLASYDGTRSNRLQWNWGDSLTTNTVAPFRPGVSFADTAKAVGMWLYVPEASTNGVAAPAVRAPIVGNVDGVIVDFSTTGVTSTELFHNGASIGVINTTGVMTVTFDTSAVVLAVGDQLAATQTTIDGTSDLSRPRGVSLPSAPTVQQPVRSVDTTVTVNAVMNAPFSTASLVTVVDTNGLTVGTAVPTGGTSVVVPLTSMLSQGDQIFATQTVNSLVSPPSPSVTVISPSASCVLAWSQDFETDTTANWTVNHGPTDDVANFFFDYVDASTIGSAAIPPAPSGGGTHGMKLQTNLTSGIFGGFSVSPTGQAFTGDYKVVFDLWANFNGPFPAGSSGSTNLSTFGVLTSGTSANFPGAVDGVWFGATGDGESSADWRAYSPAAVASYQDGDPVYAATTRNNTNAYYAGFGNVAAPAAQLALYPQQTGNTNTGSAGMAWHDVEINKAGNFVTWTVDGLLIATVNITGMTLGGDNILFGHSDINSTSSADPNDVHLLFTLIDNIRVYVPQEQPVTQGDWDGDGDRDLTDFANFADCLAGPGSAPAPSLADCSDVCLDTFDFDADGDVDLQDAAVFTGSFPLP